MSRCPPQIWWAHIVVVEIHFLLSSLKYIYIIFKSKINTYLTNRQCSLRIFPNYFICLFSHLLIVSILFLIVAEPETKTKNPRAPNARLDFFSLWEPPSKNTPKNHFFDPKFFVWPHMSIMKDFRGDCKKIFFLFFSKFSKGPPFGYFW